MTTDDFWAFTGHVDLDALDAGDEIQAIAPLVACLSALSRQELESYEEQLAVQLYQLDTEDFAKQAGAAGTSADGFLYCRCYVVARGRVFYESVLANPSQMPRRLEQWCEPLLGAAAEAWAAATGHDPEDWDYETRVSYETGSNSSRWTPGLAPRATPEDPDPFVEPNLSRAVARAGHAFRSRQYGNVVKLLGPHEAQLSKKLLRMLIESRDHQANAGSG